MQLRGEAHLGVDDAVGGQVQGALAGDPDERVLGLHHPDGVGERLEVQPQVAAVGAGVEPGGQLVDVGGGQAVVAVLRGELDDGGGPQPPVEVVVQEDLGGAPQRVEGERHGADATDPGPTLASRRAPSRGAQHGPSGAARVLRMTDWDHEAATFDDEPDHGLRDPQVRAAWADLLLPLVPTGSRVADLGCGTGTLTRAARRRGPHPRRGRHQPGDARRSPGPRCPARAFLLGDAAAPPLEPGSVDVVLCRHVLWALPDPDAALRTWVRLLAPGGRLLLVEGAWWTGGGLTAARTRELVLGCIGPRRR